MHVTDVPDPRVASGDPDQAITVLDKPYALHDHAIQRMELRLYANPGGWTITAYVEMDGHTVETTYEEGSGGDSPLQDAAEFLASSLGPAGAILRAGIVLKAALDRHSGDARPGKV